MPQVNRIREAMELIRVNQFSPQRLKIDLSEKMFVSFRQAGNYISEMNQMGFIEAHGMYVELTAKGLNYLLEFQKKKLNDGQLE